MELTIRELCVRAHQNAENKGFWDTRQLAVVSGMGAQDLVVKLSLIMTEVAEAIKALQVGNDEEFIEEIADIYIRTSDLTGGIGAANSIERVITSKMERNESRPRLHGKLF